MIKDISKIIFLSDMDGTLLTYDKRLPGKFIRKGRYGYDRYF